MIYRYNARGELSAAVKPSGLQTSYTRDSRGCLTATTDDRGVERTFETDIDCLPIKETSGGIVTKHAYGPAREPTSTTLAFGTPDASTSTTLYQVGTMDGRLLAVDATQGNGLSHVRRGYNVLGEELTVVNPIDGSGSTCAVTRNADGTHRIRCTRLGQSGTWEALYNAMGQILSERDWNGATTTHEYQPESGKVRKVTSAVTVQTMNLDKYGRLASETTANVDGTLIGSTTNTYATTGNVQLVQRTTDLAGNITSFSYDARDRLSVTADGTGSQEVVVYQSDGRSDLQAYMGTFGPSSGGVTSGRVEACTYYPSSAPAGSRGQVQYCQIGATVTSAGTVPDLQPPNERYAYDALGRRSTVTRVLDEKTSSTLTVTHHPFCGELNTSNELQTNFVTYDALCRKTSESAGGGSPLKTFAYSWNPDTGTMARVTYPDKSTTTYTQAAGVGTGIRYTSADNTSRPAPGAVTVRTDGACNRRTFMSDDSGCTSYTYEPSNDCSGRITSEKRLNVPGCSSTDAPGAVSVTYAYTGAFLTSVTYSPSTTTAATVQYGYQNGQLQTVTPWGNPPFTVAERKYGDGRPTKISGPLNVDLDYDFTGSASTAAISKNGASVFGQTHTYDAREVLTQASLSVAGGPSQVTGYAYDSAYRLVTAALPDLTALGGPAGGVEKIGYNASDRVQSVVGPGREGAVFLNFDAKDTVVSSPRFRYDPNNNLTLVPPMEGSDVNNDFSVDIVWRHYSSSPGTGKIVTWLMNGETYVGNAPTSTVDDANWVLSAIGDFNQDKVPDYVWRHLANSDQVIWLMKPVASRLGSNAERASGVPLARAVADKNWHIVAAADFDGDANDDLVWENVASGDHEVWFMNGTAYADAHATLPNTGVISNPPPAPAGTSAGWHIFGAADVDGDGEPDLLFQNLSSGALVVWFMATTGTHTVTLRNSAYVASSTGTSLAAAPPWFAVGTGDFNGDGFRDVLWYNQSTTELVVWHLDGATTRVAGVPQPRLTTNSGAYVMTATPGTEMPSGIRAGTGDALWWPKSR